MTMNDPDVDGAGQSPAGEPAATGRISELEAETAALKDKLQRALADFQNFRRQAEKRLGEVKLFVQKDVFGQVLPIADTLEAALDAMQKGSDPKTIVAGVKMSQEMMLKVLSDNRVEPIKTAGETFDPALHEAIASVPSAELEANKIVYEAQRGWRIGDTVVRYAKVAVAVPPENS
jgi:molecular chaperone GrpE